MICPFCNKSLDDIDKNELLQKGWTCRFCGKSIPSFSNLKTTKNSYIKSKAKQLYIEIFFPEFKSLTFIQYKTHKHKIYADALSFKDIVNALEKGIDSFDKWPKCKYCQERPTYLGKDFCMHCECIQKANYHKNPMVKNPKATMEKIKKSLLSKYGISNVNELEYVREAKRQKQLQYWHNISHRIERATKLNEQHGVYNVKQHKQTIDAIRSKLGLSSKTSYDIFLKAIYERIFLNLNKVELLEPESFNEFILKQGDGNTRYKFKCKRCGCVFYKYVSPISVAYNKLINNIEIIKCPRCYASKSLLEKKVLNAILEHVNQTSFNVVTNDHKLIYPYEVDIAINTGNYTIAIDVDGTFFHSTQHLKAFAKDYDDFMNRFYKLKRKLTDKYQRIFANSTLRYLAISELSWSQYKDFWLSKILLLLEQRQHFKRYYAREVNIRLIDHKVAKSFLDRYHIQRYIHATYHIGFFHNNELIGVASFGKTSSRQALSKQNGTLYELYRLAFKPFVHVVGGISKLNSFVSKHLSLRSYVTYIDLALGFNSQSWEKLGFDVISHEPLTYAVVDNENQTIRHRLYIRNFIPKGYTESKFVFESDRFDLMLKPGNAKLKIEL